MNIYEYERDLIMSKRIEQLKSEYINYYTDCPVQKYAAMYVGRDEDTILRWRKNDTKFADQVEKAKATFVRKKLLKSRAEFSLERLDREIFGRCEQITSRQHVIVDINDGNATKLQNEFKEFMLRRTRAEPSEV